MAWLAGGGTTLLTLLSVAFLARPHWFLPRNPLALATTIARLAGIHVTYPADAILKIESLSFRDKRITLDSPSLCYDGIAPHASGCFGHVYAQVEIRLAAFPPRLLKVGPITAMDGRFRVQLDTEKAKDAGPTDPAKVPDLAVSPLTFEFKSLRIDAAQWALETALTFRTSPDYSLVAHGKFTQDGRPKPFQLDLRGQGNEKLAKGRIEGWVERPIPELRHVSLDACGFELKNLLTAKMQWNLLCPTEVTPTDNVIPNEWTSGWDGKLRLLVRAEGGTTASRDPKGNVEIDLLPFRTDIVHGHGKVQFHLEDLTKEKLAAAVEIDAHVVNFQRAVNVVEDKAYAVPSPLNAMEGELVVSTDGRAEIDLKSGRIPFLVQTKLGSPSQTFVTKATGAISFRRVAKQTLVNLDADVSLANVELVLPPLEPGKLPRLFPDPRIKFPDREVAEAKSNFQYRIKIHTDNGGPMRLVSNLATAPVPLDLTLFLSSESDATGTLRINSFPVEILRRKATVHHFRVELAEGAKSPPIDGEVDVKYAEYRLKILINGTVEVPHLSIDSNPPLSEEDAYSVLVFGRPLSELSPTDGDTVANLRAAVSNRAMGLASMYLLATTPIESVTYDPTSNTFAARIRIADGTSLNVGGGLRSLNQLGLKRRLSPSWILNTFIDNPFGTQQQRSVSSFLEWSKRY